MLLICYRLGLLTIASSALGGKLQENMGDTSVTTITFTISADNLTTTTQATTYPVSATTETMTTTTLPTIRTTEVFVLGKNANISQFGNTTSGCVIYFNTTTSNQTCCFHTEEKKHCPKNQENSCRKQGTSRSNSIDHYVLEKEEGKCTLILPDFLLSDVGFYEFVFPANPKRLIVVEVLSRNNNRGELWWVLGLGLGLGLGLAILILIAIYLQRERTTPTTPDVQMCSINPLFDREALFLTACEDGNEAVIITLLETDANLLLIVDDDNNSPLHLAVKNKRLDIIRLLLNTSLKENNRLLNMKNTEQVTAIEIAARSSLPIVKYIIAELGDRSWKTHQMNLVYSAIVNGDENMLAFLKSQGAEYSGESTFPGSDENFLFRAVKEKKATAVRFIMNHEDLRPDKSTVRLALKTANNFIANAHPTDKIKSWNQIISCLH